MNRKVFVAAIIGMLVFSLVAVGAKEGKTTIHIQTFGYEGKDLLKLTVEITGEDSDYLFITIDSDVLNKVAKEINIEKLPFVQISDTTFKVLKSYLTEIGTNEYVIVVPNDAAKMKWSIKDKVKDMNGKDIVRVLVWFKEPNSVVTVNKYGKVYYEFLSGMGASVDVRVSDIKALSEEDAIAFVEAEGTAQILLSQSGPMINADDVWSMGYDGTNVKICIIDTGIDPNHCDFPSGKIVAWADFVGSQSTPYDDHGHGTHVASIAAGADSPYGIAPGASLMGAKVCTSGGSCSYTAIINGIDWGVANGADVENISLGDTGGDGTSAVAQECNWAVDQGVVVVCAAGDDGPACYTINTPGDATKVITVGACDKSGALASFSSRGPTTDNRIKPDIVAPGVSIYAAMKGTSCSDTSMSGTSMATPHIAGVAALMLDARGTATPLQIKNCLGATAIDMCRPNKDSASGWGLVDAYAAVNQVINNPNVSPPPDGDWSCICECIEITSPENSQIVSCDVQITTDASTEVTTVKFYIDSDLLYTDTEYPFECQWDTCEKPNGYHTITAQAYGQQLLAGSSEILDVPICSDVITVWVSNECIEITNPPDDSEVYGTVHITTDAGCCVDEVEFYIDSVYKDTDFSSPFEYFWDTTGYTEDEEHTISVKAYYKGQLKCTEEVTVTVNNYYVEITNPPDESEVSGTITITTNYRGIDEVQFCIGDDNYCMGKDTEPPFEFIWDTTQYPNGIHTITARGFESIFLKAEDSISCTISNQSMSIFLGLLFGCVGIMIRRH
jgi:serine protease AprX